jgi:hypothetical protein
MWTMSKKPENEGLSLGYRFFWRFQYVLLHIYGPAQLPDHADPRKQLERQRAAKVAAARAAREAGEAGAARQGLIRGRRQR